jgi:hypothetical protein
MIDILRHFNFCRIRYIMKIGYYTMLILYFLFCVKAGYASQGFDVKSVQGVYAGEHLNDIDKISVSHLREGVKKIFGIDLKVLTSENDMTDKEKLIVIGTQDVVLKTHPRKEEDFQTIPIGGFIIRSDNDGVVITGNDSWSTLAGVYRFLEEIGMHFYLPQFNQAKITVSASGEIPFLSISAKPSFLYRSGTNLVWHQMFNQLGDPKNGLNPELFDTKKTGSDLWIDHTAGYLVPKLMFSDAHPEYYALVGGKRIASDRFTDHRTPLCLSNPDVATISKERALGWIEKEKNKNYFMITYGDTGVWCQCSECLKLDAHSGKYSDRLLSWVNPIARAVQDKYPDKILMTFAYGGADDPPTKEKPEKNILVVGSTGLGNIPFWDHARKNPQTLQDSIDKITGWLKVAPDQYALCEYQANQYKPALVDALSSRLRFYKELGVRGIVFTYGVPQNFKGLWGYLYSHLMWDIDQDVMQLARSYVEFYFKEAAEYIWQVFSLSHGRYTETLSQGISLTNNYPTGFYNNEFSLSVTSAFSSAAEAVKHDDKLYKEIQQEESYFIMDWMRHPGYSQLDDKGEQVLVNQLERLLVLSGQNDKDKLQLGRDLHKIALAVEESHPGTQKIVENWILTKKIYTPFYEKRPNGVVLQPESFLFAGFGPAKYGLNCPPRDAAGVYVKGNSQHRSHRMIAEFGWELSPSQVEGPLLLTLTGQVSSSDLLKPQIKILINNTEIYSGSADFVSNNWSSQGYKIPTGIIREGINSFEIQNTSSPLSIISWNQRWCLISSAEILFQKDGGQAK